MIHVQKRSHYTRSKYLLKVKEFLEYLDNEKLELNAKTANDYTRKIYFETLERPSVLENTSTALSSFFCFFGDKNLIKGYEIKKNPRRKQIKYPLPKLCTYQRFFDAESHFYPKELVACKFLVATGLRKSEFLNLTPESFGRKKDLPQEIDFSRFWIKGIKGGDNRWIREIKGGMIAKQLFEQKMFPLQKNISYIYFRRTITYCLKNYFNIEGEYNCSANVLRRLHIGLLQLLKAPEPMLIHQMGHKNIETTRKSYFACATELSEDFFLTT